MSEQNSIRILSVDDHPLLREGIGWGNMPRHMIAGDLAAGTLVTLTLPEDPGLDYALSALWRRDVRPGPAACWTLRTRSRAW